MGNGKISSDTYNVQTKLRNPGKVGNAAHSCPALTVKEEGEERRWAQTFCYIP